MNEQIRKYLESCHDDEGWELTPKGPMKPQPQTED